ncbi:MAG: ComF family protein [Alphaproteobacteria bacterium]|nr:ComF family protein [Alphaproteobacteria bacterium]MCB9792372.1 ComF family protein [Alphaproteobacteria bacterium]
MLKLALDLLSPPRCAGCDADLDSELAAEPAAGWCESCSRQLPRWLWPRSPEPAWLASAWSWGRYDGPPGVAIRRAKYGGDERALASVSARVSHAAEGRLPRIDRVVPVPQPWTRSLQRGFSPTAILARGLSRRLDVPLAQPLRRRPGAAQAGLDDEARAQNVAAAFSGRGSLEGLRVLLVDDVITTGATASAAARELLNLGAARVHLLAACDARA